MDVPWHPRNRHQGRYDLPALLRVLPALKPYLSRTPQGEPTVDFAHPDAVRALNTALLSHWYGLTGWSIPPGALCPPVPGRAEAIHRLADLLAEDGQGLQHRRLLDIGTGVSGIYPLIAHGEYRWTSVGTDLPGAALDHLQRFIDRQRLPIILRRQTDHRRCFTGIWQDGERFDAVICNPPFYQSASEAARATAHKWSNLGGGRPPPSFRSFGGRDQELWCPGGEVGFIERMIEESRTFGDRCRWFTTLVARGGHLGRLEHRARQAGATGVRSLPMSTGGKASRLLAWTFTSGASDGPVAGAVRPRGPDRSLQPPDA